MKSNLIRLPPSRTVCETLASVPGEPVVTVASTVAAGAPCGPCGPTEPCVPAGETTTSTVSPLVATSVGTACPLTVAAGVVWPVTETVGAACPLT